MDLTEGSETSAKHNLTPGKYPKEHIQQTAIFSRHSEVHGKTIFLISTPSFRLPVTTKVGRVNEASLPE
jgi:hypothetical protein